MLAMLSLSRFECCGRFERPLSVGTPPEERHMPSAVDIAALEPLSLGELRSSGLDITRQFQRYAPPTFSA